MIFDEDMNQLSVPVAIIVFKRPDLTRKVLNQIAKAKPTHLFVISDGPRANHENEFEAVQRTRAVFDEISWPCEVTKIYSDSNLGLRQRVLSGLDEVFKKVDRAIILEDDCIPSLDFFVFSSTLLEKYSTSANVALISGNNFAPKKNDCNTYYFSTHANIWGWATWKRTWMDFRASKQVNELNRNEVKNILDRVSGFYQRRKFAKLLRASSRLDSWAIQFATFVYLRRLTSIVPSQNLVTNLGFGAGSTHTKFESWADEIPRGEMRFPLIHPVGIEPNFAEMRRESRVKILRWVSYPAKHPFDAIGRIFRYKEWRSEKS